MANRPILNGWQSRRDGQAARTLTTIMMIRPKICALLGAIFVVLAFVEWGVGKLFLLPRFEEIEQESAVTAMTRVKLGLDEQLSELQISANDWANWGDTFRFAADHNQRYVTENLSPSAIRQLHLSTMTVVAPSGKILWTDSMATEQAAAGRLDPFAGTALPGDFPWLDTIAQAQQVHGMVATSGGVLLLASSPILDGYGAGQSRGAVLLGRLLTAQKLADIGRKVQTAVTRVDNPGLLTAGIVSTEDTTQVFRTFQDIYGRPAITLRVDVPRTISARARATVYYATAFTIAAAVIALAFVLLLLNNTILNPLHRLTRHAVQLGTGGDLTARLNLNRADEIGALAHEFDAMVEQLAASRRQVIDHSFQSGMAELARGVLHNIGNAVTPLSVRLAKVQEALRDAPTTDVERAATELKAPGLAPERQADLEHFLRLCAAPLTRAIRAAEEHLIVVLRQAKIVQNALLEQSNTSRGTAVIEAVQLPALIAQTLDIVPETCKDRVQIELSPSINEIGTVHLGRSVLRLVLQNLIINAAESIYATGAASGLLRFTATIAPESARKVLLLECKDTGGGIDASLLERIFDHGFSTKLAHGNSGVGLHWCATALSALGGRIWASSDGIGHGATFHLSIPLGQSAAPFTPEMA